MNESQKPQRPQDLLERQVDRALRGLAPRRAPRSLEVRVIAELARRAALPWWRRRILQWPPAARAAFIVVCGGLIRFAWPATGWAIAEFGALRRSGAPALSWIHYGAAAVSGAAQLLNVIAGALPMSWIAAGLVFAAMLYAALFGLGAVAYRTLYLNP
ncbi:MAG TPA: hypothetical protein VMV25_12515 [Steroidobacteraceae bacterium]|nr:hypothetical protein [Steroidobacteraceae bacterium]